MLARLRALFQRIGAALRKEMAAKLRQGKGITGRQLPRKKVPNGRPLGFDTRSRGLPGVLERGKVAVTGESVTVSYADAHLTYFHFGTSRGQVARPVVGVAQAQAQRFMGQVVAEVEREAIRTGIFKKAKRGGGR